LYNGAKLEIQNTPIELDPFFAQEEKLAMVSNSGLCLAFSQTSSALANSLAHLMPEV